MTTEMVVHPGRMSLAVNFPAFNEASVAGDRGAAHGADMLVCVGDDGSTDSTVVATAGVTVLRLAVNTLSAALAGCTRWRSTSVCAERIGARVGNAPAHLRYRGGDRSPFRASPHGT